MTEAEKAYQYFVIAVPENEEQAKAYFWARKALRPVSRERVENVWRGEWIKRHKHRGGFRRVKGIDDMGEQHEVTIDERCVRKAKPGQLLEFLWVLRRSHDGRGRGHGDGENGGAEKWQGP